MPRKKNMELNLKKVMLFLTAKQLAILENHRDETGSPISETVRRILNKHFGLNETKEPKIAADSMIKNTQV